jgi:hypothetical protein
VQAGRMRASISPFSPVNEAKDRSYSLRAGETSSSSLCDGFFLPLLMNERDLPQRNAEVKKRQDKKRESLCKIFPHFSSAV